MSQKVSAFICLAALLMLPGTARAAETADPDWPCVQRLVPRIAVAQVWQGPEPDPAAWRDDADVRRLASQLAARKTPLGDTEKLVDDFAASLPKEAVNDKLTALFGRTLDLINRDRASIIAGIKRFARHQRALAERISNTRAQLKDIGGSAADESGGIATEAGSSSGTSSAEADLQELLTWDLRIFEERNRSMTYLCEQPVLLEQRAFALGRTVYFFMED